MKVDLILNNVKVLDVYFKKFVPASVAVLNGKFFYIGNDELDQLEPENVVDCGGRYMVPGLIDIHLHIESTMSTPAAFSHGLIRNGVTTVVSEPHEIANVFGVEGVRAMIAAGKDCAADIYYGAPSSVPSTLPELETTGAELGLPELAELMEEERVICLGEVMNYMDVIRDPHCKSRELVNYMREHHPRLAVEGHCPRILGLDLARFVAAGIDSDHTLQTVEGIRQRISNGVLVEIQEKSMSPEVISYLADNDLCERFCFVTDDVMADTFVERGHLNGLVRKAISMGMDADRAICSATIVPARRMGLVDRGAIAPGRLADFVLLDDPADFSIARVYKRGKLVHDADRPEEFRPAGRAFPERFYESVHLKPITADDLRIAVPDGKETVVCRAMETDDRTTFTREVQAELPVRGGVLNWEDSSCALAAVFERHHGSGRIGFGLVTGNVIERGAVATTYAHDHHNLMVIGRNVDDMVEAANRLIERQGGYCAVEDGSVLASIDLPVAGLLSEESLETIGERVRGLRKAMKHLGYDHQNAIMALSVLSLPVSPAIKITDRGLIDVLELKRLDLFVE